MDDRGCPVGRRQGLTDTDFTPAPSGIQQRSLLGEENPRVPLFPAAAHSHPREPSPRGRVNGWKNRLVERKGDGARKEE